MTRLRLFAFLPFAAALAPFAAGCGARSALDDVGAAETGGTGGGGAGGAGGGAGGTTTTTSTTTTATAVCDGLVVQPTFVTPPVNAVVSKPRTALFSFSSDVLLTALVQAAGPSGASLYAGVLSAFTEWPPLYATVVPIDNGVLDYELGPGPEGPVALTQHAGAGGVLFEKLVPESTFFDVPINEADEVLFVTAVKDRWFFAQASLPGPYYVLSPGSYQPGSLPQSEDPLVCTTTPLLGAAIPSGQGFLAAFTEPAPSGQACDSQAPQPGSTIELHRYDSPPESGSFLQHTAGVQVAGSEPLAHLAMTEASFGAWMVYQFDGSTSFTPPPLTATRFDGTGQFLTSFEGFDVTPPGYISPEVAVASLGDTLAVAWVDTLDPSASTVVIQLVRPDGTLGPAVSIPTNEAWLSGGLRLLASPQANSLLVSWAGPPEQGVVALARVDCVQAL